MRAYVHELFQLVSWVMNYSIASRIPPGQFPRALLALRKMINDKCIAALSTLGARPALCARRWRARPRRPPPAPTVLRGQASEWQPETDLSWNPLKNECRWPFWIIPGPGMVKYGPKMIFGPFLWCFYLFLLLIQRSGESFWFLKSIF